jgi:hypothetical protein
MPYIATALNHSNQYTLMATLAVGSCACTIVTIKSNGSMSSELLTSPNGIRTIPTGAARMMFFANAPEAMTGIFKVTQNGLTLCDLVIGGSAPVDLVVTFTVT